MSRRWVSLVSGARPRARLAFSQGWHTRSIGRPVVFHSGADTENLHTVLFVWGLVLLAQPASANLTRSAGGGSLIGLSALARGVSLGFLPLAAAWQLRTSGGKRGLGLAAVSLGCGLAAVSPWTLRDYRLTGELVPIERSRSSTPGTTTPWWTKATGGDGPA